MAYYTYNDTKVTVNENLFFVNQISINSITNLSSKYISQERSSFDRVAQEGIRGSLSFSYFLTGSDPLKEYTIDEKKAISVNFAGLYFNSGYLTSFSFSAQPHSPILIEAGIDFFTPLVGTFSPQREKLPDNKILTFEGISIDNSGIQKDTIR